MKTTRRLWVKDIRRILLDESGVSLEDLIGPNRADRLVNARFVFARLVCEFLPQITRTRIAKDWLKRDHTSVRNLLMRPDVYLARPGVPELMARCRHRIEFLCAQEAQRAPLTPVVAAPPPEAPPKPKPRPAAPYEPSRGALYAPVTPAGLWRDEDPLVMQCRRNEQRMRKAFLAAHPELVSGIDENN